MHLWVTSGSSEAIDSWPAAIERLVMKMLAGVRTLVNVRVLVLRGRNRENRHL